MCVLCFILEAFSYFLVNENFAKDLKLISKEKILCTLKYLRASDGMKLNCSLLAIVLQFEHNIDIFLHGSSCI